MIINELKQLIKENKGKLKIGPLEFGWEEGEDIDVHIGSTLVMWFPASSDGELSIDSVEWSMSLDLEAKEKAEKEARQARKDLEESKKIIENSQNAVGMVAAYEKILLGRDVTISK